MYSSKVSFAALAAVVLALALGAQAGTVYQKGDVFVSIGNGEVQEYTPSGVLVQTLNDGSGSAFTTGMAFDSSSNLYITNFSTGTVSKMDNAGNIVNSAWATGMSSPESISPGKGGSFPVLVGDANSNVIRQFDSNGTLMNSWTVNIQDRGTDWVDLQPDAKTVYYTSEGTSIFSFNISNGTQNANFFDGLPSTAYALRTVLSGQFAGDVLVADSSAAYLVSSKGIVMTYNLPGNAGGDFSLNLDPSGTAFWTGDFNSGRVWEVEIANGSILQQWDTGSSSLFGIAVYGEQGQGGNAPEPGTLVLIGTGVLGAFARLRKMVA